LLYGGLTLIVILAIIIMVNVLLERLFKDW